jgi:hypothetical protein
LGTIVIFSFFELLMLFMTENNMLIKKIALFPVNNKENKPPALGVAAGKIRRPPNAFILFSQKFRKVVAAAHPEETNIAISKR